MLFEYLLYKTVKITHLKSVNAGFFCISIGSKNKPVGCVFNACSFLFTVLVNYNSILPNHYFLPLIANNVILSLMLLVLIHDGFLRLNLKDDDLLKRRDYYFICHCLKNVVQVYYGCEV